MAAAKRRRRRRKSARRRFFDRVFIFLVLIISIGALAAVGYLYWNRDTGIGDEQLELCLTGNTMNIAWEDTEAVDFIRLYREDPVNDRTVLIGEYKENYAVIENVKSGEELTLKFEPVRIRKIGSYDFEMKSRRKSVTIVPKELTIPNLSDTIGEDLKTVNLSWLMENGCVCEIYNLDGFDGKELLVSTEEQGATLTVGDQIEMPLRGEPVRLISRVYKQEKNCKQYSIYGEELHITREELLPDTISIVTGLTLDGPYTFSWEEAKPDTYEFMEFNEETNTWETLKVCSADDDLSYQIEWLPSEKVVCYKVLAYFSNPSSEEEEGYIESNQLAVRSKRTPLFCTIWPIQKLDVYADDSTNETIGSVAAGQTLCVLEESAGRFKVRTDDGYGYIDENFVMINLPEFLGDLCHYDITNSYASKFKVHDYNIPSLTNRVVPGFEKICLSEDEKEFVVPFIYPCAVKLAVAAETASANNYVLKIYEAFRPHVATRYMYDTTETILQTRVPFVDDQGREVGTDVALSSDTGADGNTEISEKHENDMDWEFDSDEAIAIAAAGGEGIPLRKQIYALCATQAMAEGYDINTDAGKVRIIQLIPMMKLNVQSPIILASQGIDANSEPGQILLQDMIAKQPTYEAAMTNNGSMRLSAFLAKVTSAHNKGIALDLTLEVRDSGEEIEMQSPIHDLSFYSITSRNNENAKLLNEYMTGAGFNDLSSEWWHFQDDETRNSVGLGAYLEEGVSIAGWKCNMRGWRYQLENGDYYRNTTETIDGVSYTFDEKGYCEEFE